MGPPRACGTSARLVDTLSAVTAGTSAEPRRATGLHRASPAPIRQLLPRAVAPLAVLAIGIVLVVSAIIRARTTTDLDYVGVYWAGFLAGTAGVVALWRAVARFRWSGWAFALALGAFTYLPKYMLSGNGPVYYDEWGHFRHLRDLEATHDLFVGQTFLPIVKYFPGLSVSTFVIQTVSRLSAWHAALLTVLLAHMLTLVAVRSLAMRVGLSHDRAGVAALIYALGPNFTYFDAQYAYETLGLPLALLTVDRAIALTHAKSRRDLGRQALYTVILCACTILTHHLSAVFAVLVMAVVLAAAILGRHCNRVTGLVAAGVGMLCLALAASWLVVVAGAVGYVKPKVVIGIQQALTVIGLRSDAAGQPAGRSLLRSTVIPLYEVVCSYTSVILVGLAMVWAVFSLLRQRSWMTPQQRQAALLFAALGLLFFATFPLILSSNQGAEVAHRSWAFSWVGVAITIAGLNPRLRRARANHDPREDPDAGRADRRTVAVRFALKIVVGICASVMVVGLAVDGTNSDYRFPGPYEFGSDTRSINADELRLADWLVRSGHDHGGVITDRWTGTVLTGYTDLSIPGSTNITLYRLYSTPLHLDPDLITQMQRLNYRLFIVDSNFEGHLGKQLILYPGADSYYRIHPGHLRRLVEMGGDEDFALIKRIGHYYVFELVGSAG